MSRVVYSSEGSGGGMSNQDFRRLLEERAHTVAATPARVSDEHESEGGHSGEGGKHKKKSRGSAKYQAYLRYMERKKEREEEQSKYRDRAAERRMYGRDLDYRDVPDVNVDELPAEQTKYLGGDLQHTHLVKGLDYQLLAKLKEQAERMEEERFEQALAQVEAMPLESKAPVKKKKHKDLFGDVDLETAVKESKMGKGEHEEEEVTVEGEGEEKLTFRTLMARNLWNVLKTAELAYKVTPVEHFLPGRTVYEYEIDSKPFSSSFGLGSSARRDIPVTTIVPREDTHGNENRVMGSVTDDVRKRLHRIMTYLREEKEGKRAGGKSGEGKEAKDGAEGKKKEVVPMDDDDIFSGLPSSSSASSSSSAAGPMFPLPSRPAVTQAATGERRSYFLKPAAEEEEMKIIAQQRAESVTEDTEEATTAAPAAGAISLSASYTELFSPLPSSSSSSPSRAPSSSRSAEVLGAAAPLVGPAKPRPVEGATAPQQLLQQAQKEKLTVEEEMRRKLREEMLFSSTTLSEQAQMQLELLERKLKKGERLTPQEQAKYNRLKELEGDSYDGYGEAYPSMSYYEAIGYDSDEEGGGKKKRRRGGGDSPDSPPAHVNAKKERQKYDRQWQQVQTIIERQQAKKRERDRDALAADSERAAKRAAILRGFKTQQPQP